MHFTFLILSTYILICIILFFMHQNLSNIFFYPKSKRLLSFLLLLLSLFFHRCTRRVLKYFFHASVDRKQTRMTHVSIQGDIPLQHLFSVHLRIIISQATSTTVIPKVKLRDARELGANEKRGRGIIGKRESAMSLHFFSPSHYSFRPRFPFNN